MDDRVADGTGPNGGDVIEAAQVIQDAERTWVQDAANGLWVPATHEGTEQQPRQCGQVWPAQAHWREGLVQEVPIKSPQVWPRHRASGKAHGRGSGGSGGGGGDGGGDNIFS